MSIKLKKNWDSPLAPPLGDREKRGHFVGREPQIEMLKTEILEKNSGAILLSGYRGVGKTSLVYETLYRVKEKDKKIISVFLNASQLEAESESNKRIDPKLIIQNLIRRLYSTINRSSSLKLSSKERGKLDSLYEKAIATSLKSTKQLDNIENLSSLRAKEDESVLSGQITFAQIVSLIGLAASGIFLYELDSFFDIPEHFLALARFLSGLSFAQIPLAYNRLSKTRTATEQSQAQHRKASELYEFDNSIGNLEFDLEQFQSDFRENGYKLVYIIDELDKLSVQQVYEITKFFKNLFTLSDAIFIFIGTEPIFDYVGEAEKSNIEPQSTPISVRNIF